MPETTAHGYDERIDVASFKVASFLSDLDVLRSELERLDESYPGPDTDTGALARLVVATVDWKRAARTIAEDAEKICQLASGVYTEATCTLTDEYRRRINEGLRESMYDVDEEASRS